MAFSTKLALVATLIAATSVAAFGQKEKFDIDSHANADEAVGSGHRDVTEKGLDTLLGVEPYLLISQLRIKS